MMYPLGKQENGDNEVNKYIYENTEEQIDLDDFS